MGLNRSYEISFLGMRTNQVSTLLIELKHKSYWAIKAFNHDLRFAGSHRKLQLQELEEFLNEAYKNAKTHKE